MLKMVFLITKGINDKIKAQHVFISDTYNTAREYFEGYLFGEMNPENFKLYKFGNIDDKLKFNEQMFFLCDGFQIIYGNSLKEKAYNNTQLTLKKVALKNFIKKQKEKLIDTGFQLDNIKNIFEGEEIK